MEENLSSGSIKVGQLTLIDVSREGMRLGTTKVQRGADRTDGANSAEHREYAFPKKIKDLQ
jgi:hypothetical protein